jgi:hypothetical protein
MYSKLKCNGVQEIPSEVLKDRYVKLPCRAKKEGQYKPAIFRIKEGLLCRILGF